MSSSQAQRQELIFISRLSRGRGKQVRKSDPILTLWIGLFSDLFNIEKDCLGWEGGRRRGEILWHILCPLVSKNIFVSHFMILKIHHIVKYLKVFI